MLSGAIKNFFPERRKNWGVVLDPTGAMPGPLGGLVQRLLAGALACGLMIGGCMGPWVGHWVGNCLGMHWPMPLDFDGPGMCRWLVHAVFGWVGG